MRWDGLFADLEGQLEAEHRAERDAEVAERTRIERGAVDLPSRLLAQVGAQTRLRLVTGAQHEGTLTDVGADWLLLREARRELLVPTVALVSVADLAPRTRDDRAARRFGLGYALRLLARDRCPVLVSDRSGQASTGTIDVVGADYLDLAEHALGEPRRAGNLRGRRTVPFAGLASVASGMP
jgi:hypothetical protein